MSSNVVLIDDPAPQVRRVTLNRPEKRNALNHALRGGIVRALQEADQDPGVRVMIVRGAGPCFSSGYDLGGGNEGQEYPWYTAGGDGHWPRHVTQGWMSIWELAKPVIAQVHGFCLAGGSELATCCDLVYMADDAQMGYPAVRFGVPDNHFHPWFLGMRKAMEMMLTGDSISGVEAAQRGWANASFPADQLEAQGARSRAAHRRRAGRSRSAQQARGAPADGDHGPAHRHPRGLGALRARHPPEEPARVPGPDPQAGPDRRAPGARRAVRGLPHEEGGRLNATGFEPGVRGFESLSARRALLKTDCDIKNERDRTLAVKMSYILESLSQGNVGSERRPST